MANKIKTFFKLLKTLENPIIYLKDYFGLIKNKPIIYRLRNGPKLKVRGGSTDRFILNEIWIHKSYLPNGFEINSNDVVVDIGAHIGVFSIMAAYYANLGKVYSFEPMKENFNLLNENINLNRLSNITSFNKAVSDKDGKLKFFVSKTKNKGQNSMTRLSENQEEISVDKISFKKFIKKIPQINFLKMDCEGSEYDIFYSLNKKELAKIKKIAMEYHNYGKGTGKELREFLEKNDFSVNMIIDGKEFGTIYAINNKK